MQASVSVVPTGDRTAALMLFELANICVQDIVLKCLRFETVEFLSVMPMGQAESSLVAEVDLSRLRKFKKKKIVRTTRVVHPNESDAFSVGMAAPGLNGLHCSWRLYVSVESNLGAIELGQHEIFIPGSRQGKKVSLETMRADFREVFMENKKGIPWHERLGMYFRDPFWYRGFSFHYMWPMMYYSGPDNFLRNQSP